MKTLITICAFLFNVYFAFGMDSVKVDFSFDNSLNISTPFKFFVIGFDTNMVLRKTLETSSNSPTFSLYLPKNLNYTFYIEQSSIKDGTFLVEIEPDYKYNQHKYFSRDTVLILKNLSSNIYQKSKNIKPINILDKNNNTLIDAVILINDRYSSWTSRFIGFSGSNNIYIEENNYKFDILILTLNNDYFSGYYKDGDYPQICPYSATLLDTHQLSNTKFYLEYKNAKPNGNCKINGFIFAPINENKHNGNIILSDFEYNNQLFTLTDSLKKPYITNFFYNQSFNSFDFKFNKILPGTYYISYYKDFPFCKDSLKYYKVVLNSDCSTIPEEIYISLGGGDVKENKISQENIFPTPANNYIIIEMQNELINANCIIYNIYGIEMLNLNNLNTESMKLKIDINDLNSGIYYAVINNKEQRNIAKINVVK